MNKNLIIIGASGHGKVVADIALKMNCYESIAFLDDNTSLKECLGLPVVAESKQVEQYIVNHDIFIAIGNARKRHEFMEVLNKKDAVIPTLIHPNAVFGKDTYIDSGTVVMAGTVINSGSIIGKGCILNTCSSIDHDCIIHDFVHISVGVHLAGNVEVGNKTWIGAGATVSNGVNICDECTIGAGGVVIKNILNSGTYIGVPAVLLKGISKI